MSQLTANGLVLTTLQQIVDRLTADMQAIYGPNINVQPNSPDGQLIRIVAQAIVDLQELAAQVNAGFDPDQAIGRVLDQRCAINGVFRKEGTYTTTNVSVTADRALTLPGLDTAPDAPFTVADASGNRFVLANAYTFGGAATQSLAFRAAALGEVLTVPNTITQIVTATLGVTAVNNPSAATATGTNEETDAQLRVRRQKSVALPSQGYLDGLVGALQSVDGVSQAIVRENNTGTTDGDGIPGHSIWCIVEGGTDEDVATAIYNKRNAGCGMRGATSYAVSQIDGTTFTVLFDRPTPQNLWIEFDVTAITGTVDDNYIRQQLLARLSYDIAQDADSSSIIALCKEIAPNGSFSDEGVSDDNITYAPLVSPTGLNYQFAVASSRIIINGVPGS